MTLLGLTTEDQIFWGVALGLGLVVILVVIAVLLLLRTLVRDIDVGVATLWTVTQRMAQNTTGTYQLGGTASIAQALREELIRHDKLLEEI